MAQTEAQLRASKKYHQKFDDLRIRVPAGEKVDIDSHAQAMGESTNAFVCRAVRETMERDVAQGRYGNNANHRLK
jgi:hypothetical protein